MFSTTTTMKTAALLLISSGWVRSVLGHANVTSPPIRSPGQNFLTACGQTSFNEVKGDPTGHIEEQEPVTPGCVLTLCRGMPFSDTPPANVQQVSPGQQMTMDVVCSIPHGGPANVSLVDTTVGGSGKAIGSFLASFDNFCPTSGPTPSDQTNLQFNLPDANTIGGKCQTAGDCVVQLFWATPDFSQNYYYCVDVAIATNTSSSGGSSTSGSSGGVSISNTNSNTPTIGGFSTSTTGATTSTGTGTNTAASSQKTSAARRRARLLWF